MLIVMCPCGFVSWHLIGGVWRCARCGERADGGRYTGVLRKREPAVVAVESFPNARAVGMSTEINVLDLGDKRYAVDTPNAIVVRYPKPMIVTQASQHWEGDELITLIVTRNQRGAVQ